MREILLIISATVISDRRRYLFLTRYRISTRSAMENAREKERRVFGTLLRTRRMYVGSSSLRDYLEDTSETFGEHASFSAERRHFSVKAASPYIHFIVTAGAR